MIKLAERSYRKELLDNDQIPFDDIRRNMKELNTINTWLGGHAITLAGVNTILNNFPAKKELHICEIGCGGGDNLQAIHRSLSSRKNIRFTGIDIKPECISFARQQYPELPAQWICSDYRLADLSQDPPDIIFASLFCHHFTETELLLMLPWMYRNSRLGFFINDLHRHPLAYYSIRLITRLFSRSYLVKNDAPLSVARGFTKNEWEKILQQADITSSQVQWKWAFRHLITVIKDDN